MKISDTSHHGKAGSNPAFDATYRGSGLARAVASRVRFFCQEAPALMSLTTDIACSPACFFRVPKAPSLLHAGEGREGAFGKAAVKMSVTSGESAAPLLRFGGRGFVYRRPKCRSSVNCSAERQQRHLFAANQFTIRGEDRCYFVCKTRGRGFESRPAFHAPVAQWSERCQAGRVTCGPASQQSPVPGSCPSCRW